MGIEQWENCKVLKALSQKGNVVLILDEESGKKYVKKTLEQYDFGVYKSIIDNPVKGMPKIEAMQIIGGKLTVIEEYITGLTVEQYLAERGVFPRDDAVSFINQLCNTLKILHARKPAIIHRDIKPANVIVTPEGRAVLIDYDAAKFERNDRAADTVLLGTFGHAAPEQYGFAPSGPQTDIFGLGVLLNQMLCGLLPTDEIYSKSRKISDIIKKSTQMEPKNRYKNIRGFQKEIKRILHHYIAWLPPGFRSHNVLKMIVAVLGYWFIFGTAFIDMKENPTDGYSDAIATLFIFLFAVFFYCNYLGIRRFFPLVNSENIFLKILGFIIGPFITLAIIALLGSVGGILFNLAAGVIML